MSRRFPRPLSGSLKSQHGLSTLRISMNELHRDGEFQQVPSSHRGSSAKWLSERFFKSVSRLQAGGKHQEIPLAKKTEEE